MVDIDKVCAILNENGMYFDKNNPDERLDMDSLTSISILVTIENVFNMEISDADLLEYPSTLRQIISIVEKHNSSQAAQSA